MTSDHQLTPIPVSLNVPDITRARLALVEPTAFTRRMYLTLNVLLKHMDPSGFCDGLTVQELADYAGCSKRTIQRGMNDLGILGWIVRKPQKITRRYNEPNRYQALQKGALGKRRRLRAKPKKKAVSSAGDDSYGRDQSSPDLSRCAGPVALPTSPSVLGEGVAPRPADPEGYEGGMAPAPDAPPRTPANEVELPVTGPAQPEIPERAAVDAHDDLDVIGPRTAHALRDPIPVLHQRIQETLIAAGAGDIIGDDYEGRIARKFPRHTEEQILAKVRAAGQLRKIDLFKAGTGPCVWTSGTVSERRGAFYNKLSRKIAQPVTSRTYDPPTKPRPGTKDADGYFVPEKSHGLLAGSQIVEPAGEDRARAQNPAQGSGSSTPVSARVDALQPRAHVSGMSTAAAIARVRAALAASYHDVTPLAEHATEAVARTIVDRHSADGPNGCRLTTDDICATIAHYATFQAFKAKRNEMVPPSATLLRFLMAEIRNATPGCAKTIRAKLADTKFIPSKTQRQNATKQPGDSLAHLDRPKVRLTMEMLQSSGFFDPKTKPTTPPTVPAKRQRTDEEVADFYAKLEAARKGAGSTGT